MLHLPHHDGSVFYVDTQAPKIGDLVTLRLRVPEVSATSRVWLRYVVDGEPMFVHAQRVRVPSGSENETWWEAKLEVRNPVVSYRWRLDEPDRWVNQLGTVRHDPTDASDFRLVTFPPPPDWAADAVFYQIFPDRFARSTTADDWQHFPEWAQPSAWDDPVVMPMPGAMTQMYGGDLYGATEHVDHLVALGINAVYSTPVFPGRSNHRYDASTFDEADPVLGGNDGLASFVDALHSCGIRFVGDLTTNHTGVTHEWFVKAAADQNSDERSYYNFDPSFEDGVETWLGVKSLPKLDHRSTKLQDRMFTDESSVVRKFLQPPFSFDGWRIDVANMTGRSGNVDVNADVARRLRNSMAESASDTLLIAEHCHDASLDLVGDGWYSTMNYMGFANPVSGWLGSWFPDDGPDHPNRLRVLTGPEMQAGIDGFAAAISWRSRVTNLNLLDSHDSVRFRSMVGGDDMRHRAGVVMLMTFPGMPSVFQGDEFAMTAQHSHGTRAPMPWGDVRATEADAMLDFFATIIAARNSSVALRRGGFRWVIVANDVVAFLREHMDQTVLVLVARSEIDESTCDEILYGLAASGRSTIGTDLLTGADTSVSVALEAMRSPGASFAVLELR